MHRTSARLSRLRSRGRSRWIHSRLLGPMWMGTDMAGQPYAKAALIRVRRYVSQRSECRDHASHRHRDLPLARKHASQQVVALTASTDEARMTAALRAGAAGFVRKDAEPEILLAAVRAVARGRTYLDPSVGRQILEARVAHDDLTPREIAVLRRLALGRSNKEIADALDIGEETVKTRVGNVLSKLQVENRAQAIVQALRRRLVSLEELE
jgi:DNA-binding CsgD family transcriptional regulator